MRVALVIPAFQYTGQYSSSLAMCDFPVGFAYLAAALKKAGHEVVGVNPNNCPACSTAREMIQKKLKIMLDEQKPQLIGLGGLCTDYPFIRDAMAIIRTYAPEVPVVCGGGIITHDAEFVFNLLKPDYCIIGEAEETFVRLIERLEAGRLPEGIPNVGYWREGVARLNETLYEYPPVETRAFPDYSPFDAELMIANSSVAARSAYRYPRPYPRIIPFVAARGCPFSCTFCVHHQGPKYRARPISAIMEEIGQLYEKYRFNIIMILDELFAIDKKRLQEFCEGIMEGRRALGWDFDWAFQTHANARLGRRELKMAKAAGCYLFSYGLESSSPRVLASMNKKTRPEQIAEAVALATEAGIGFGGCYIFGDPAETPETLSETMAFFQQHCLDEHVYFQPISPYPGSQLFDLCIQRGLIRDKRSYYETIDSVLYNMTGIPDKQWFEWIRSVIRPLNTIPHVITVEPNEVKQDCAPRDDNGTLPLWLVTACCPHCNTTHLFREPLSEQSVAAGNSAFLTGCASCGKRFKIAARREGRYSGVNAQRSIAPENLKTVIQNGIGKLVPPRQKAFVTEPGEIDDRGKPNRRPNSPRILFVQHELFTWARAKMWGYAWHLGLEEGLRANNVEFTTLMTTWFPRAKEILAGKRFDQVWINDITHIFEPGGYGGYQLGLQDLEWLAGLAPVRVGFLTESLEHTPEEFAGNRSLSFARSVLETTGRYMTHIMTPDEKDIPFIQHLHGKPTAHYIGAIPSRFIAREVGPPSSNKPVFRGTPDGERARWLSLPQIRDAVNRLPSLDNRSALPVLFDELQRLAKEKVAAPAFSDDLYAYYLQASRQIRAQAFTTYLESLAEGSAVLNFPTYCKIYPSKIYEGMASGRPVITVQLEDRPLLQSLFEDGVDILLYPKDNPQAIASQIDRLLQDPDYARQMAVNARDRLLRHHTTEHRVCQFLDWIKSAEEPQYDTTYTTNPKFEPSPQPAMEVHLSEAKPAGASAAV